eukprot:9498600-Alexandrium_andersonii.AAC.1
MVSEPPDVDNGLVDRIVAQSALAQRRARQDRARIAAPDHQDNQNLVAGFLGAEAIIHCDLRHL